MFLQFEDVASLSLVCKRLSEVVQNSGKIWKCLLWAMYPETSLLEYPRQSFSENDTEENDHITLPQNNDESFEPSSKKAHESTDLSNLHNNECSRISELSTGTNDNDSKVQNCKNYWKNHFENRYLIGVRAKEWLQR